ncbi:helix-turn-helix domain-containing protein [Streptomyces sp. NPDC048581]|uniref:helix-turn-helix domain-containing protein n=1 Tax=unclassified Streptomyces TaxID=2593676 RepID=UPI0037122CEA
MSEVQDDDVQVFAALLRRLKERTDRSYGQLARRLNMNTSTLHRYCAGEAVPLDFAPVERFAALCRATPEERVELHRLWIRAVAARQRARTAGPPSTADSTTASAAAAPPTADSAPSPADDAPSELPDEPAPTPTEPPRRPWYRRRSLLVSAAVATALLATLGSLTALPDDNRPRASDSVQGADPTRTTEPGTPRPKSTRSPSPSPTSPSPSVGTSKEKESSAKPTETAGQPSKEADKQPPSGVPLTWSADSHVWNAGCGHDYVTSKSPQQVAPPPAPQDAAVWAASQSAVHGRQTMVEISVQGRTSTAVVLEALRVRVVGRSAPLEGNSYAMNNGCGGALTPRYFDVDLDKDRPIARPVDGNDSGVTIPAMRLPYRVSAEDPEVLLVDAQTTGCTCDWYLELDWSSQGRTGTVRIDDHGRPFRTTSIKGLPRYEYDTSARAWRAYS